MRADKLRLAAGFLSGPWQPLWPAGLLLGLAGLAGATYMLIVLWLARNRLERSTGALRLAVVEGRGLGVARCYHSNITAALVLEFKPAIV